jgi:hypothetical protein
MEPLKIQSDSLSSLKPHFFWRRPRLDMPEASVVAFGAPIVRMRPLAAPLDFKRCLGLVSVPGPAATLPQHSAVVFDPTHPAAQQVNTGLCAWNVVLPTLGACQQTQNLTPHPSV